MSCPFRIPPELADYHVAKMTAIELGERFQIYVRNGLADSRTITGAELSVAGPKSRAGHVSSTRFSRPATMTAGRRHSTLFPAVREIDFCQFFELVIPCWLRFSSQAGTRSCQIRR